MPLVYILTNKWYRADNMYKVGKHYSNDIDKLLAQYPPRYMPGRELVKYWIAEDCTTTEFIVHAALDNTLGIERVEGEWFRGDIDKILAVIEKYIDRCVQDPYTIRVEINDEVRVYPLSLLPNERLIRLGNYLGIDNPLDVSNDRWRSLQINLLFFQKRIIDMYETRGNMRQESRDKFSRLTGYPADEKLIGKLYIHVNPNLSSKDAYQISASILSNPPRVQSQRIATRMEQGRVPYTYDTTRTASTQLQQQLVYQTRVHNEDYESMTTRELRDILRQKAPRGYSYISRKEDIIRAIRNPELISSMIEEARSKRSKNENAS